MAKLLNPLGSGQASGSIMGLTYAYWRGRGIVRRKSQPVRRLRTTQPWIRSLIGYLSRQYQLLLEAERLLWKAYADAHPRLDVFGNAYTMTPAQAFTAINHVGINIAGSILQTTPPMAVVPATIATLVAEPTLVAGELDVNWTFEGVGEADDFVEIKLSRPILSASKKMLPEDLPFNAAVAGNLLTKSITGLVSGAVYWVAARYVDEFGQTTAWHMAYGSPL